MPTPKRRAGRLTRVEAARRAERVVEVAANMFLERGFDATSMEAVAEKAGIAKPTLYAWYRDKAELFTAVLRRQIEHFLGPLGRRQHDLEGTDAESALTEIGRHVIAVAWSPGALAVRRIVTVQAERFPELERLAISDTPLRLWVGYYATRGRERPRRSASRRPYASSSKASA
jgi:TetR/AcrR family transcriptional repressor of mexJK operon